MEILDDESQLDVLIKGNWKTRNIWQKTNVKQSKTEKHKFLKTVVNNFELLEGKLEPHQAISFFKKSNNQSIIFLIEGNVSLSTSSLALDLTKEDCLFISEINQEISLTSNKRTHFLMLTFLTNIYRPTVNDNMLGRINIKLNTIIKVIINSRLNHHVDTLFLSTKILELLYLFFNKSEKTDTRLLPPDEENKIEEAKTIIAQNIQNPCSLIELAHQVGLNDFKLKKGFKETYGTTVFGYLHDLRMQKAKEMLVENRKIADVAYEIGYKNAHHFSAAFKKYFGLLPNKWKSNKSLRDF